jgi:hypothetical protein
MTDKKRATEEVKPARGASPQSALVTEGGTRATRGASSQGAKEKLKLQARMFDMGHAPKERVANRVFEKVTRDGKAPTDERLHEILADEHTREDIQEIYG